MLGLLSSSLIASERVRAESRGALLSECVLVCCVCCLLVASLGVRSRLATDRARLCRGNERCRSSELRLSRDQACAPPFVAHCSASRPCCVGLSLPSLPRLCSARVLLALLFSRVIVQRRQRADPRAPQSGGEESTSGLHSETAQQQATGAKKQCKTIGRSLRGCSASTKHVRAWKEDGIAVVRICACDSQLTAGELSKMPTNVQCVSKEAGMGFARESGV